jgi:hypothetical protein
MVTQTKPKTATEARGLSSEETQILQDLAGRAGLTLVQAEGLAEYQALTNISVAVRDSKTGKKTDKNHVVRAGDLVKLDEEEARNLLDSGPGTGRMTPAIRPKSQARAPMPTLLPRNLTGPIRQPPPPAPGTDGPRPDPAGSSSIIEVNPKLPELNDPQTDTDTRVGGDEAVDLPPTGAGRNAAAALRR